MPDTNQSIELSEVKPDIRVTKRITDIAVPDACSVCWGTKWRRIHGFTVNTHTDISLN